MTPEIEIDIRCHARERAYHERHGEEIDLARFRPTDRVRDALRLWVDDEGRGLMISEAHTRDLSWIKLTVVTALSAHQVADIDVIDVRPYRRAKVTEASRIACAHIHGEHPPTPAGDGLDTLLVDYLRENPGSKLNDVIAELGCKATPDTAGRLRKEGVLYRDKHKRWYTHEDAP